MSSCFWGHKTMHVLNAENRLRIFGFDADNIILVCLDCEMYFTNREVWRTRNSIIIEHDEAISRTDDLELKFKRFMFRFT